MNTNLYQFEEAILWLRFDKMVRNLAKRLKTHLHNGSIYFPNGSFPKKLNIFGEIIVERYDLGFSSSKL
jgi:hypothetical protein